MFFPEKKYRERLLICLFVLTVRMAKSATSKTFTSTALNYFYRRKTLAHSKVTTTWIGNNFCAGYGGVQNLECTLYLGYTMSKVSNSHSSLLKAHRGEQT